MHDDSEEPLLSIDYLQIRNVIRYLMALTLIPLQYVPILFDELNKDQNKLNHQKLNDLFSYFRMN
jgi:hypothetical protein